jgi:hypothetical protein
MESKQKQPANLPPPPGLIATFAKGFDAIANNVAVIVLPAILDLFLWLGPRLRLKQLLGQLFAELSNLAAPPASLGLDVNQVQQVWAEFLERFNLFSLLRTFPVGIASLMSGSMPDQTPLGSPPGFEAASFFSVMGWWLVLAVLGWLLGSVYFYWVSGVALNPEQPRSFSRSITHSLLLSAAWVALLLAFGLPAFLFFSVLTLISPALAEAAMFILALLSLWLALPVFFSPHGIFIYQQNALISILSGARMVRYTLPASGLFLLSTIIIGQGLDFLWRTPPENSWLTLVGIAGHAFISTAILATSFIYYRDVNAWLQEVAGKMKAQANSVQA